MKKEINEKIKQKILENARELAKEFNLSETGFRTAENYWCFLEDDVKEAVRLLKEELFDEGAIKIINKIFGDKLTNE